MSQGGAKAFKRLLRWPGPAFQAPRRTPDLNVEAAAADGKQILRIARRPYVNIELEGRGGTDHVQELDYSSRASQRGAKRTPRSLQETPEMAWASPTTRAPRGSPQELRMAHEGPRRPQGDPGPPQGSTRGPMTAPREPKRAHHEAPRRLQYCLQTRRWPHRASEEKDEDEEE